MLNLKKLINIFIVFFVLFSSFYFISPKKARAVESDTKVFYKLSSLSYYDARLELKKITSQLSNNWVFVEQIDDMYNPYHPAFRPYGAISSSFSASVFVNNKEKKLIVAYRGTQATESWKDWQNNLRAVTSDDNVQAKNAHLYLNYIYKNYPKYQDYKWYFTGHSLGGWLAQKLYLDAKTGKEYNTDQKKYTYYGKIRKKDITRIVTFNALPLTKYNTTASMWNSMSNDSKVTNYVIKNEALNEFITVWPNDYKYRGQIIYIDKNIKNVYQMGYSRQQLQKMPKIDFIKFIFTNRDKFSKIIGGHSLSNFSNLN